MFISLYCGACRSGVAIHRVHGCFGRNGAVNREEQIKENPDPGARVLFMGGISRIRQDP
jgi:hypothetical protein